MKVWRLPERWGRVFNFTESNMTNHQDKNAELEKIYQLRQELWLSALMHSPDIERTYQDLRQSIIETHQTIQKNLNDAYADAMSHSLSLTDGLSAKDKEELAKESREMLLEIHKSAGTNEQTLKDRLEQELTDLENIKNQVIATRKQRKTSFFIAIIIVLIITIGVYVLR